MKRDELEHVLRAASHIVKQRDFLVIGSAAIPGTCSEDVLPRAASRSEEADLIRRLAARQRPVRWSWAWALALAVLYAASDELHQGFVAGRHAAAVDVGIDATGEGDFSAGHLRRGAAASSARISVRARSSSGWATRRSYASTRVKSSSAAYVRS